MTTTEQKNSELANRIADEYLAKFPRRLSYGVTLVSSEDDSEMTFYRAFSDEELDILRECFRIANEEDLDLHEILESEGHEELLEKLLQHNLPMILDIVESADVEHPLKFADFSYQTLEEDGSLADKWRIRTDLTDEEFKEILVELMLNSNCYSMNMLVYRKPELAQKIMKHIAYASLDYLFENHSPFIAEMDELKSICDSIMNPFKDILAIFHSDDADVKDFAEKHQIVPDCGPDNVFFEEYGEQDSCHVQLHFIGTVVEITQQKIKGAGESHEMESFKMEASVLMDKFGLEKPEEIYPYLKEHYHTADCYRQLYDVFR